MKDDLAEICFECTGYGDDYTMDENGKLVSCCDDCWVTQLEDDE